MGNKSSISNDYSHISLIETNQQIKSVYNEATISLLNKCENGTENDLIKLVENGADVNAINQQIKSLLLVACQRKFNQLALLLIDKGAKLYLKNQDQMNPLLVAYKCNMEDVVCKISDKMENKEDFDPIKEIFLDVENIKEMIIIKIVNLFITKNLDFVIIGASKEQLLIWSCYRKLSKLASFMIEQRTKIDNYDTTRRTPLLWAVINKMDDVSYQLIEKGADANVHDHRGMTSLMYACKNKNQKLAICMIDSCIKRSDFSFLNIKNDNGQTFIDYAKEFVLVDVLKKVNDTYKVISEKIGGSYP